MAVMVSVAGVDYPNSRPPRWSLRGPQQKDLCSFQDFQSPEEARMIISHSRRFIFVHIHKAGGTSIESALSEHLTWSDLILGSTPLGQAMDDQFRKRYGLDKHSSVRDIERVCGAEVVRNYYLFSLVRHPLDRLCSLYNFVGSIIERWARSKSISIAQIPDFVAKHPKLAVPSLTWPASIAFLESSSFAEFIRHERLTMDQGFHSQVSRLRGLSGESLEGDVFRLEDLSNWLPKLCSSLKIDFSMPHLNKSQLKLVTREIVPAVDAQYIENCYAEDFAAFGY
jgi:hypothetical protein